jgi:hypothetical protein
MLHHGKEAWKGCILDDASREERRRFRKCHREVGMHTRRRITGKRPSWADRRDAYQTTHHGREAQYGRQVGMHTRRRITGAMPRDGVREGMHPRRCIAGERPTVLSTGDRRDAY